MTLYQNQANICTLKHVYDFYSNPAASQVLNHLSQYTSGTYKQCVEHWVTTLTTSIRVKMKKDIFLKHE